MVGKVGTDDKFELRTKSDARIRSECTAHLNLDKFPTLCLRNQKKKSLLKFGVSQLGILLEYDVGYRCRAKSHDLVVDSVELAFDPDLRL